MRCGAPSRLRNCAPTHSAYRRCPWCWLCNVGILPSVLGITKVGTCKAIMEIVRCWLQAMPSNKPTDSTTLHSWSKTDSGRYVVTTAVTPKLWWLVVDIGDVGDVDGVHVVDGVVVNTVVCSAVFVLPWIVFARGFTWYCCMALTLNCPSSAARKAYTDQQCKHTYLNTITAMRHKDCSPPLWRRSPRQCWRFKDRPPRLGDFPLARAKHHQRKYTKGCIDNRCVAATSKFLTHGDETNKCENGKFPIQRHRPTFDVISKRQRRMGILILLAPKK